MLFNDSARQRRARPAADRERVRAALPAQPARASSPRCRRASTPDRPQRQPALGRPAPAPGDRARDLQGRADPDPRRGHLGARQRIRARLVQDALDRLMGAHQLVIAHRLSTIEHADRIVALDGRTPGRRRAGHACQPLLAPAASPPGCTPFSSGAPHDQAKHFALYPDQCLPSTRCRRREAAHPRGAGEVGLRAQRLPALAHRPDEFRAFFAYHDADAAPRPQQGRRR